MRGQVKVYQKKIVSKRRRRWFYFSFYTAVLCGLIIAALSYISQLDSLTLSEVSVRGNVRLTRGDVERIVFSKIAGNHLGLFSKANALLYPRVEIEDAVGELPLVKEVSVSRSGFNTLVVMLEERKEVANWCDEHVSGETSCFSVDENGLVFAELASGCGPHVCTPKNASTSPLFTYRGSSEVNPLGTYIVPPGDFKNIQFFISQIEGLSVDPVAATISSTTDYMIIALAAGGKIIVNRTDDLSTILENISVVLKDRSVAPSFSDFLTNLDYIKFDAGNKVVYKTKETVSDKKPPAR